MKVFFDTNVLVSAFTARGLCADLFKGAMATCTFVTSDPLLDEVRRVLSDKFEASRESVDEAIAIIEEDAGKAPGGAHLNLRIRDRDDIRILSSALHGKADVFITGDKEVLALGEVGGMRIVSPRQFWEILRNR